MRVSKVLKNAVKLGEKNQKPGGLQCLAGAQPKADFPRIFGV